MPEMRVSPRERLVLTAIIELYIATGEPVASQAVAHAVCQPRRAELGHDPQRDGDAGRGRTAGAAAHLGWARSHGGGVSLLRGADHARPDRARLSRIGAVGGCTGAQADSAERRAARADRGELFGVTSTQRVSGADVACAGADFQRAGGGAGQLDGEQVLEHIHFSRLSTGRVLAVLVTQAGAVLDRVLTLDRELTHLELETAARYLNENFRGWPIERIRAEVARRMEVERAAYHQMLASVEELCRKGALAGGESGAGDLCGRNGEPDCRRGGPRAAAADAAGAGGQAAAGGIADCLCGWDASRKCVWWWGWIEASPAMQDLVLIGAPARLGGASLGTVAVIAPTRIQYQEMIQAVRYIARLSERILEVPAD